MIPTQAMHVLNILSDWTRRGWHYLPKRYSLPGTQDMFAVFYTDPDPAHFPSDIGDDRFLHLRAFGATPFEALFHATIVMQALLEAYPEKPHDPDH